MSRWQRFWWAFTLAWRFARTRGDITRQQRRALERELEESYGRTVGR